MVNIGGGGGARRDYIYTGRSILMDRMEELIRITWSAAGTLFLFGFISAWYAHNMMWFGINGVGTLITLTAAFSWERRYQRPIPLAAGTPQKEESCCICLDPLVETSQHSPVSTPTTAPV